MTLEERSIDHDQRQTPKHKEEQLNDTSSEWYHTGIRERLRRLEMSAVVDFGPNDEALKAMVVSLAERALKNLEDGKSPDSKHAVATVLNELQGEKARRDCLETIIRALNPMAWVGKHRLVEAFQTRDVTACYDVSLMIHLVLEEMGDKGSHLVGFLSPSSHAPSFGVVHEGSIYTFEKGDWSKVEAFQRLLRSEKTSDRLHNIYPPLSIPELLKEWVEKARGLRKNKKPAEVNS